MGISYESRCQTDRSYMEVPRLVEHVSCALQGYTSQDVILHLTLLEVIHVDVNSIYIAVQLLDLR